MELGIEGRRAIVCGASRGIGQAIALQLAREGVVVSLVARTREGLAETAGQISAAGLPAPQIVVADLMTEEGRMHVMTCCPSPDILINNGGGAPPGDFRDWARPEWIHALDMMMLAPIDMIRRVMDGMIARGFGRIVNITARSVKNPHAVLGLSAAARTGLVAFSSGLSRQVVKHNVTINSVLPGIVASEAQFSHIRGLSAMTGRSYDELWAEKARANPAGRFGTPEEIACTTAFLCGAQAGFMTGQSLLVDGGDYSGLF
ncbi:SDR family oxidoreductase [Komagataeibacter xylinus]|uniref:SDR family oxidoreductase n=1 Tax=Komagataeibacter xylinus TaxID=28448 RepID=UPI000FDF6F55|nr:SDR family oxidoreductase [Komagataeibacter xylinus]AZV38111.1 oxidoreductase [Komagataeibacter xylinus]